MTSKPFGDRPGRRYVRLPGPFEGLHLAPVAAPILIYELNLGGGFVKFFGGQPAQPKFELRIDLPNEDSIMVNAEVVYRHQLGVAVRFVHVDPNAMTRLMRTVINVTGN